MNMLALFFDVILIGLLIAGISYAVKLSRQLSALQASRAEMERFVIDFSATVVRAENGIKGLKAAARSGGDDLERLIDKASGLKDELHLLTCSADQIATRLSKTAERAAQNVLSKESSRATQPAQHVQEDRSATPLAVGTKPATAPPSFVASSAAERELLQALKKIG